MDKDAISYVIDAKTNKVLDKFYTGDSYKKTTSEQKEYRDKYVMNFNSDRGFVKIYDDVIIKLKVILTPQEFITTISLMPYVCYNDCIIRKCPDNRGKIVNLKELSEMTNIGYDQLRKNMSSLKKKGVVGKFEVGEIIKSDEYVLRDIWVVNPYIYFRGDNVNRTVKEFFDKTIWNPDYVYQSSIQREYTP